MTYQQLIRIGRKQKKNKKDKILTYTTRSSKQNPKVLQRPFIAGRCKLVRIQTPRKPNSAQRKVAKVQLTNGKIIIAYIPGIGHNLAEHSSVLVKGQGARDLPGVRYTIVRGKADCAGVKGCKNKRSKSGEKRPKPQAATAVGAAKKSNRGS